MLHAYLFIAPIIIPIRHLPGQSSRRDSPLQLLQGGTYPRPLHLHRAGELPATC